MKTPYSKTNRIYKCISGDKPHYKHFLTGPMVRKMTVIENRYPITQLPVCGYCEKAAMWTKNAANQMVGWCENCGTTTDKPITYSEYLLRGEDLPEHLRNSQLGKEVRAMLDNYDAIYGLSEGAAR